ncbi:hypothetical protein PQO03_12335 [Lentisphaera profundi]|uniref:Semialdehyde dehydrogenase NAD-binding domain-containing protein n=1 Tax=Lentisphaera profundi TaxID=1658616 RepID=A0ABY7VWP5_9BACT|nr:hypothetical protein [Lentisphaera profundi]WDE98625.1 hypothetical protein PQO03_12335 [Lentisphaera profundi]
MLKVYIDGQYGTSGLILHSLVENHPLLKCITISANKRRDEKLRVQCFTEADLVVLCLPDNEVQKTLTLIPKHKRVIDCGVSLRSDPKWIYGLPELGEKQRKTIRDAKYVANPGCFALAFILLVKPLIDSDYISSSSLVSVFAVNGYSAGGQRMIKHYESGRSKGQIHNLNQSHKHIPEMMRFCGLNQRPNFIPSVGAHKEGLVLTLPLINSKRSELLKLYREKYLNEKLIILYDNTVNNLSPVYLKNDIEIYINREEDCVISVRMSNLLKGAAGTALQNINIMLGMDECLGLY